MSSFQGDFIKKDNNVFKDKKEHANSLRKHAYTFGGNK